MVCDRTVYVTERLVVNSALYHKVLASFLPSFLSFSSLSFTPLPLDSCAVVLPMSRVQQGSDCGCLCLPGRENLLSTTLQAALQTQGQLQ